jgi:bifunctional NMN adenylyltransferase/nudix hydrolase
MPLHTKYDLLVFIGRFQPFHIQHKRNVDVALDRAEEVILLVGSAGRSRSVRNPWTFEEREAMIRSCYNHETNLRIGIRPLPDSAYNDSAWVESVQDIVKDYCSTRIFDGQETRSIPGATPDKPKIGLIGANKDNSSYYLNLFPKWGSVDTGYMDQIHATGLRKLFFEEDALAHELVDNLIPKPVCNWLYNEFKGSKPYEQIKEEAAHVRAYKKQWAASPYPPIFSTVDAVVEQSGHVLLVRRRASPGRGLLALPGGFVNQDETLKDAMLRELSEETKIKVPRAALEGSIRSNECFDDPYRSDRGRTITMAYHLKLKDGTLPRVRGGDDAAQALWVPLNELRPDNLFEDHFFIIQKMLGLPA